MKVKSYKILKRKIFFLLEDYEREKSVVLHTHIKTYFDNTENKKSHNNLKI